jgi:hypothetical protein
LTTIKKINLAFTALLLLIMGCGGNRTTDEQCGYNILAGGAIITAPTGQSYRVVGEDTLSDGSVRYYIPGEKCTKIPITLGQAGEMITLSGSYAGKYLIGNDNYIRRISE